MFKSNSPQRVEITGWSFAKLLILILGLFFLYYIRSVVALVFVVIILVAGLNPTIQSIEKYKIPRALAVTLIYILIFIFISFLVYLVIPPMIEQISALASGFSYYSSKLNNITLGFASDLLGGKTNLQALADTLGKLTGGVFDSIFNIFGGAASALTIMVLTFYILLERDSVEKFIFTFIPKDKKEYALSIYKKISIKLGNWLRGQIILALIMAVTSYIVLRIMNIPYALTLATLAGILEIVPIIGPIIAAMVAISVTFIAGDWWQAVIVLIAYTAMQQLEAHLLVPKLMGKAVGLSPIIIIIALLVGAKIGGIIGAILAIPIAAGISVVIQEWPNISGKRGEKIPES